MLFHAFLAPLLIAAAAYASNLRTEKATKSYEGPLTLGAHTYASRKEFIMSGRRCGTRDLPEDRLFEIDQKLASVPRETESSGPEGLASSARTWMATVGVYFHVITTSGGDGAVSDLDIQAQMAVLNAAYGQVNARFVLKGTTRTANDGWFDLEIDSSEETAMKSSLRVGDADDLNVYTVTNSEDILGWATWPADYQGNKPNDGVVIDFRTLPNGAMAPYNEGATLVHEAGHWMGLYHTFQGGCAKRYQNGDHVSDTPCVAEANFGCPADSTNSCPGDKNQFAGNDLVHNYMDYTDDDCMYQFTKGQKARMRQNWLAYRKNL